MYYYQDVLGLPATFVGLILMIARVFDAFNDPFMGVLVAKTRTCWGTVPSVDPQRHRPECGGSLTRCLPRRCWRVPT